MNEFHRLALPVNSSVTSVIIHTQGFQNAANYFFENLHVNFKIVRNSIPWTPFRMVQPSAAIIQTPFYQILDLPQSACIQITGVESKALVHGVKVLM